MSDHHPDPRTAEIKVGEEQKIEKDPLGESLWEGQCQNSELTCLSPPFGLVTGEIPGWVISKPGPPCHGSHNSCQDHRLLPHRDLIRVKHTSRVVFQNIENLCTVFFHNKKKFFLFISKGVQERFAGSLPKGLYRKNLGQAENRGFIQVPHGEHTVTWAMFCFLGCVGCELAQKWSSRESAL